MASLVVIKTGSGAVTSSPAGIDCGATCTTKLPIGTVVTLTATPDAGNNLTAWGGSCTGSGSTCSFTLTGDTGVTATFELASFDVTVSVGNNGLGAITSTPAGINCPGTCTASVPFGTVLALTATPDVSSTFSGWGDACAAAGTNATCMITVGAAASSVSAGFALRTFMLTAATSGTGIGGITSTPAGIDCGNGNTMCTATYNYGQMVTLTAAPGAQSTFGGWSGACSGTGTCTITMDQARSVTAMFALNTYALSVTKTGTGATAGTVTASAGAINCGATCSDVYNAGAMVTLTATPGTENNFNGWSGATGCTTATTCMVTMDSAVNVTAMFTRNQYTVTINKNGTQAASGTVTSSPGLINCGATCSDTVDYGTSITLSQSAGANTTFAGWSGGSCSGTSSCTFTVTANVTITATFNVGSYDTSITGSPLSTTTSTNATFSFVSIPAGAGSFTCSLDDGPFTSCTSPITYTGLAFTYHQFRVAAPSDPTPASYQWQITGGTGPRLPDSLTAFCSDGTNAVACPSAAPAGQDGNYRINVPVYTTTATTVTDSITGLMWERNIGTAASQTGADAYCSALNLGGFTGWRLPTRLELNTILDAGRTLPPFDTTAFPGIPQNSVFRTATPVQGVANNYWSINTNYPVLLLVNATDTQPVRCVRGSMGGGIMINYSANVVFDGRTGLYWQKTASVTTTTWQAALAACEASTVDGFTDWRLPSQKELATIVDDNRTNPAISVLFIDRQAEAFWTSTPVPSSPSSAYAINFANGANANIANPMSSTFRGRCVR